MECIGIESAKLIVTKNIIYNVGKRMADIVAIDLTWVRHQKVGGTESCVRNLLDGLAEINSKEIKIILLLSRDNAASFEKYKKFSCFELLICNVESANQKKRVIWQNTKMGSLLRNEKISVCLEPIYGAPFFGMHGINVLTTIHDLQAIHYPEYFSIARVLWMKINWKHAVRSSYKVIAISDYVKNDILNHYHVSEDKVRVIYDAVVINSSECNDSVGLDKYGIKEREYYYTVSSLLPHKNLKTLIMAIAELKRRKSPQFYPLVISGVGGKSKEEIKKLAEANDVSKDIILTAFVDDAERNMLYKNCKVFVFPSVFEGFGMPPIEAMAMGVPVLTTTLTSLREVTDGKLNYVDNPFDYAQWCSLLEGEMIVPEKQVCKDILNRYACKSIASQYIELFLGM